jgi:RNA polymerase sigma-70 factor (ECF subfamily)
MLLHDSRRDARSRAGELVLLADQDRSLWDSEQIAAGHAALHRALALGGRGPYLLQAAIAAQHTAPTTDWVAVALLYAELAQLTGSPVVQLNRAVAVAEVEGPRVALQLLDALHLDGYRYFHTTRADLLRRLKLTEAARTEYRRALSLADNETERRFLQRRLTELAHQSS